MKADLDRLMSQREIDALVIEGSDGLASVNASWNYLTDGQGAHGRIIKLRGRPAQLLYHPMEQQQAEATGLELVSMGRWDLKSIARSAPTRLAASVEAWRQILTDLGVAGRVAFCGAVEAGPFLAIVDALRAELPGIQIVGEFDNGIIEQARRTKDAAEISRLRDVGVRACEVVRHVLDFISRARVSDGTVVDAAGSPIRIGQIKQLIRVQCDAHDLEQPDGNIFAQGRDAGIPHARGDESQPLFVGQSIVFDFYPRCRRTGYFHDMTRTIAIGDAPAELLRVYGDVREAFDRVIGQLRVGQRTKYYQDLACQTLKQRGHRTIDDHWPLDEGYNHSLGHGIGLEVHEPLAFSSFVDRGDALEPGNAFTIEPGLYYPSRGLGVRLEDTFICHGDGRFESLTPLPLELIVPLRG